MEKFYAIDKTEKNIQLKDSNDLEKLYETIEGNQNFILIWGDNPKGELIISANLFSKIKNGDLILTFGGNEK